MLPEVVGRVLDQLDKGDQQSWKNESISIKRWPRNRLLTITPRQRAPRFNSEL